MLLLRNALPAAICLIIENPRRTFIQRPNRDGEDIGAFGARRVRVVVTTHSDWLLMEIGNLIREGELEQKTSESISEKVPFQVRSSRATWESAVPQG